MDIELNCKVIEIIDSYIPAIKILNMECGIASVKMDIHRDLNPVEKGDIIKLGIYRSIPPYVKGKDFLAHGYIVTKRKTDTNMKIYISLWGYLVIITTNDNELYKLANPMDKVYIKLWK